MWIDTQKIKSVTAEELPKHLRSQESITACYNYESKRKTNILHYLDTDKEIKVGDYVVLRAHKDMELPKAKRGIWSILYEHAQVLKKNKLYLEDKLILCKIKHIVGNTWDGAKINVTYTGTKTDIENFEENLTACWFEIWELIPWEIFTAYTNTKKDMYEEVLENYMAWGDA